MNVYDEDEFTENFALSVFKEMCGCFWNKLLHNEDVSGWGGGINRLQQCGLQFRCDIATWHVAF